VAGPSLISRDLRFNALPLYFARPLTRLDYFLGKLGVIAALVAAVAVGPAVFAYLIGVCFSLDLSVVKDTYPVLLGSAAYGLLITLSTGPFILALSSLSRRSLYVGIAWFGLWSISGTVAVILTELRIESMQREAHERELTAWVHDNPPPPGIQMHGYYPAMHYDSETRRMKLTGVEPGHEEEARLWMDEWSQVNAEAWDKARNAGATATRGDWRPLCSYTANLERLGEGLLNTDAAWVQIGGAWERARQMVPARMFGGPRRRGPSRPEPINERRLADMYVPQYPWTWSAGVLAGLLGLSVWTLSFRVKSLDRLR
jgi:ABC-2 type transport system permease protein